MSRSLRMSHSLRVGIATPESGFSGGLERYAWMVGQGLSGRGHAVRHLFQQTGGRDPEGFGAAFSDGSRLLTPEAVRDLDVVFIQRARGIEDLEDYGNMPLLLASHDHAHTCVRTHRYLPLNTSPCHRAPGVACVTNGCCITRERSKAGSKIALKSPFSLRSRLHALAERAPLVACSRYVADAIIRAGVSPSRVHVVHPIPREENAPLVPRPSASKVVVAAQLVRGKGVDIAIDALTHLPGDVTLTVVGDGPSMQALQNQAKQIAPDRVEFTGYVGPGEVLDYYDQARVVLVPSRWPEPFGMVGIEAMRRARPVVAAAHGGIIEWAGPQAAALFEPGSPRDLARAIRAMLDDDNAGQDALTFTADRHRHDDLIDAVETLLAGAAGGTASLSSARQ